jgi:hypothetical protein
MSTVLAGVLPAVREGDDIAEQPFVEYLGSDLLARRSALSLSPEVLAPLLGLDLFRYKEIEGGALGYVGLRVINDVIAIEAFVAAETERLVAGAPEGGVVVLYAVVDQETFTVHYPQACTELRANVYPVSLQHVAVGRAAAELSRRDRDVEVYRGDRHFDLTAARLSVGLGKNETAYLLGRNVKSYYTAERGAKPPGADTLDELQAIDDFIVDTAGELEVGVDDSGVNVVWILGDQRAFEKAYPRARVPQSDTPYPVRTLHIAAARRAQTLEAAGQPTRITFTH